MAHVYTLLLIFLLAGCGSDPGSPQQNDFRKVSTNGSPRPLAETVYAEKESPPPIAYPTASPQPLPSPSPAVTISVSFTYTRSKRTGQCSSDVEEVCQQSKDMDSSRLSELRSDYAACDWANPIANLYQINCPATCGRYTALCNHDTSYRSGLNCALPAYTQSDFCYWSF